MPPPTDSLLAVDIGNIYTRVALLDIVGGEFRFVASGQARTTIELPFNDMGEGVRQALDQLSEVTGRNFLDDSEHIIIPSQPDGSGADSLVATSSAGEALRVALVGLMPSVSVATAQKVAGSNYLKVVEVFSLGDRRREEQQIDSFLAAKPDILLIAGGTEHGSKSAVLRLVDTAIMAIRLMPQNKRPEVLYSGNRDIRADVKKRFEGLCEVTEAENMRPELDRENIDPARRQLSTLYEHVRIGRIAGYSEIARWGGSVLPTAQAQGFVVNYLNRLYKSDNGALGVDIGSSATSLAASFRGRLSLMTRPDIGVGHNAVSVLHHTTLERLLRWLPREVSPNIMRDYIYNKSLAPATVPQELDDLYLEHALARECLQITLASALPIYPDTVKGSGPSLTPYFDNILIDGAVLTRAPKPGQAALIVLDGLQPCGVTNLILDTYNLAPALGVVSALNPTATVQIMESGSFLNLGTA
ncbi:MAG: glutamate mutase L, partial [Chloroflexi bacterium]|nr:glutamate mutase L [Chloroflexota bacterium]